MHGGQKCDDCHRDVANATPLIINPALHVNGSVEVRMAQGSYNPATKTCSNLKCHGTETW